MKNAIISVGLVIIMILSLCGILSVVTNITRTNELEENINTATYQTMDKFFMDTTVESNQENENRFVSEFTANLMNLIDSDSEINVKVVKIDLSNGVFRVNATEKYKGMFKIKKSIKADRTMILDFGSSDVYKKNNITVTFYWDKDKVVKKIRATAGDSVSAPNEYTYVDNANYPIPNGFHDFKGWTKNKETNELVEFEDGKERVTEDTVYYAVFE